MSFVHIKKQERTNAQGETETRFAVQAMSIMGPGGQRKLIPNPAGSEAMAFSSLEDAVEMIRRAGFDYIFEGKKTYLMDTAPAVARRASIRTRDTASLDDAIPILVERLQDKEPSVVSNAAFALGELDDSEAILPMIELLGHEDSNVRKALAEALAKLGHPSIPALQSAFENAQVNSAERHAAHVRLTVMTAYLEMIHYHPELLSVFTPYAVHALEDENWLVRAQAALVVGHIAQTYRKHDDEDD